MSTLDDHPAQVAQRLPTSASSTRCARSACAGSATPSSVEDSPQMRGMIHKVRHLVEVVGDGDGLSRADERIGLHNLKPAPGSRQAAQARRPRRGLGHRQDRRPRPEGLRLALGRQAPGPLRGRPEPDPHADAQAARPAHEEVDAVRAVPHPHPAGQPARPRGALRRRRRGHARGAEGQGPGHAQGRPGQGPRQGRDLQAADRPRARLQPRPRASRSRPPAAPASSIARSQQS